MNTFTDEYKQILLRYLTGKVNKQTGSNVPIFNLTQDTLQKNVKRELTSMLSNLKSATSVIILGKIYTNQFDDFLIYGYYNTTNNSYGYVCVLDKNLNIVQLITEYSSGTAMQPLIALQQSETGQFYGLARENYNMDNNYQVILFNNILSSGALSGVYEVVMRNNYVIPDTASYNASYYRQDRILKSLDSPIYYITLHDSSHTIVIRFEIKVGEENTWEVFEIPEIIDTVQFDAVLDKSTGNEIFYIYGVDITSSPNQYKVYQITTVLSALDSISLGTNNVSVSLSQIFALNKDNVYLSIGDTGSSKTTLYKVNNGALTQLYSFNWSSTVQGYLLLEKIGNVIFCKKRNVSSSTTTLTVGLLQNDVIYTYDVNTVTGTASGIYDYNDFYIVSQFNMITMFVPKGNEETDLLVMDYNIGNYNGASYENVDSLSPQKARLFNNNGRLCFARNLYNKYVNGNVSVSTVEIPSTMLNDTTVIARILFGNTNINMNLDRTELEKNIYETVDINFYNKITMLDSNTEVMGVLNKPGASRINNSVSLLLDYENAQATKARVNFTDNTSSITTIDSDTQITLHQTNDNYATYDFIIYVPSNKVVSNVQIISYDETTVYCEITGTFVANAFNEITQDVYVS